MDHSVLLGEIAEFHQTAQELVGPILKAVHVDAGGEMVHELFADCR